jgi:putative ABC transport system ATP-binding protein
MYPIVCEKVSKTYQTKTEAVVAIEEVSLDVREGEVMLLIGPTGAGKTTLLRSLAGFIKVDRGEIFLLDDNLAKLKNEEKAKFFAHNIGLVFDDLSLIDSLNIEDNLLFPLVCISVNRKLHSSIVQKALSTFGLLNRKFSFPRELSLGEKQVVFLVRALIHEPKILILDDPFSGLDHQIGVKFMTLLRSYAIDKGMSIIMSSHDVRLYPFAHRLVKMQEGHIIEIMGEAARFEPPPPYMRI